MQQQLMAALELPLEPKLHVQSSLLWGTLDAVRNAILTWSLDLEKADVLGEGLQFSANERKEALPVTQHFFATTIGVVGGTISGQADIDVTQTVGERSIDLEAVRRLVQEIKRGLPLFPDEQATRLADSVGSIERELGSSSPNPGKLQQLLQSVRTTCEGAAGNLMAAGVLSMLPKILGS
jgi:hypothetical protein